MANRIADLEARGFFCRLIGHDWEPRGKSWQRLWHLAAVAASVLFVHSLFSGGVTWDEHTHFVGTKEQLKHAVNVLTGTGPQSYKWIEHDLAFYGIGTVGPALVASYIIDTFALGLPHTFSGSYTVLIHLLSFICAVSCCALVRRMVVSETGQEMTGALAAISLLVTPPFLGYGFFDYKDLPVALGVVASIYFSRLILQGCSLGLLLGFFSALLWLGAQKLAALPLAIPACLAVAYAITSAGSVRQLLETACCAAGFLLLLYLVTPPSWTEPLSFTWDNLNYMAHHGWDGTTLTGGEAIGRGSEARPRLYSPLRYLGLWYSAQMPVAILLLGLWSLGLYLQQSGTALRHLVFTTMAWSVLAIAWNQSTLYDGIRHTIFLVPLGICFIFVCVPISVWRNFRRAWIAYAAVLCADILLLHPFEYVYFNEFTRFFASEQNYETDFWGYSLKETTIRTLKLGEPTTIVVGTPPQLVQPYIGKVEVISEVDIDQVPKGAQYLHIAYSRWRASFPGCGLLLRVRRWELLAPRLLTLATAARCVKIE